MKCQNLFKSLLKIFTIMKKPESVFKRPETIIQHAKEGAILFGLSTATEEIGKELAITIDPTPTDYGYEGSTAVLRDIVMGGILGLTLGYGMDRLWSTLNPTEYKMALSLLGLDEDATRAQITAAAASKIAKKYSPDQIRRMANDYLEVSKARETLMAGQETQVVVRGQTVTIGGRTLPEAVQSEIVPPRAAETLPQAVGEQGVAVGVGQYPHSFSVVRGIKVGRSIHSPRRIKPQRGQVSKDSSKSTNNKIWRIFHEHEAGSNFANHSHHLSPQSAALSFDAFDLASCGC
jgi:hypothetical protein